MKPINDKIIKWFSPDLPFVKVHFRAMFKYPQLLWVLLSETPMVPLFAAFIHIGLPHVSVAKALALRDALYIKLLLMVVSLTFLLRVIQNSLLIA